MDKVIIHQDQGASIFEGFEIPKNKKHHNGNLDHREHNINLFS